MTSDRSCSPRASTGGPASFTGTFSIVWNCGVGHRHRLADRRADLDGRSAIPTGTSCTVTEPVLPTPPTGYTFGTPTFTPRRRSSRSRRAAARRSTRHDEQHADPRPGLPQDQQGLRPEDLAASRGTFAIVYNCGAGDVTVNLAAGGSTTVGPFDTGTSCSVSEPILPTAPTGWTFGTPSSPAARRSIVKGQPGRRGRGHGDQHDHPRPGLPQDQQGLRPEDLAASRGTFAIVYNCGAGDVDGQPRRGRLDDRRAVRHRHELLRQRAIHADAPTGWTFGTPSVTRQPGAITKGLPAAAQLVTVTNTITQNFGSLVLTKVLTGGPAGYNGPFDIVWDCGGTHAGTASLTAGQTLTVDDAIPVPGSCTVTEPVLPTAPEGYRFGTVTFVPASGIVDPRRRERGHGLGRDGQHPAPELRQPGAHQGPHRWPGGLQRPVRHRLGLRRDPRRNGLPDGRPDPDGRRRRSRSPGAAP